MMLTLRVGDPHVKVSNIEESEKLISFIADTAIKKSVNRIEILGDLFHTHAVLRLEVLDFWTWALDHLSDICEVVVLVGNHDLSGDFHNTSSALDIFMKVKNKNLKIINLPRAEGVFAYMPYFHNNEKFIEAANHLASCGAKVLVCHQTFQGSKYESGMYAPDGIDTDKISKEFVQIISGHIHSRQEFGRVKYPGTARWDTTADANQPKGVTLYSHDDTAGVILSEQYISTEEVCSPIVQISVKEGEEIPAFPTNARVAIELIGSSDWISKEKIKLKGKCSIKTKITDIKKESRKAGKGLEDFIINIFTSSTEKDRLIKYAREIGIV